MTLFCEGSSPELFEPPLLAGRVGETECVETGSDTATRPLVVTTFVCVIPSLTIVTVVIICWVLLVAGFGVVVADPADDFPIDDDVVVELEGTTDG